MASKAGAVLSLRPLVGLSRRNLGRELLAGVSLIAIAVPLNIGYAQIAGLPPTAGLYALVVPTLVYVVLVSSRQLVVSPDAAASALVASSFLTLADPSLDPLAVAGAQAILGGAVLVLAGVLRLGFVANFLSHPILVGFVSGLAVEILLSQVGKMLGIRLPKGGGFFEDLVRLAGSVGTANLASLALSSASLTILVIGRRRWPAAPWALLVIAGATLTGSALHLADHGVAVLGEVTAGPPVFALPRLPLNTWLAVLPSALALAMVAMAEGLLLSRSYAERGGYPVRPDQDLIAMGAANLGAGFSSSYSVGSSASRTAAMDLSGSRTQLPGVVLALGTLLLLSFGTGLLAAIPSPAIGAVVAVAVWGLLGLADYRHLWRVSRSEFAVAAVCALGVLVVGPIGGLGIAFVLSLVNLARRAANPPIDVLIGPDEPHVSLTQPGRIGAETAPGVVVLRFAAPLFFANGSRLVEQAKRAVQQAPSPVRRFVLDLEAVTDIDVTGAASLTTLLRWFDQEGIVVAFSRVRDDLSQRLADLHVGEGVDRFTTNREALHSVATRDTATAPGS